MSYVITAILIIIALIALKLRGKGNYYGKIFSDEHFQQIGEWVEKVLQLGEVERPSLDDGTAILTDAEVVVGFTREIDSEYDTLHFSISQRQGYTTHAVGSRVIFFLMLLVNENEANATGFYTKSTVHHFVIKKESGQDWVVNSVEQAVAGTKDYRPMPIELRDLEDQE